MKNILINTYVKDVINKNSNFNLYYGNDKDKQLQHRISYGMTQNINSWVNKTIYKSKRGYIY